MFTFPGKDINLKEITNHPAGLLAAEEVLIPSSNGNMIYGVYVDNDAKKTVYYFHGNGAPIEYFYSDMQYISDLGYNVIAFDFPWYGKSTWEPSFEENSDFAEVFYNAMKEKLWFEDKDLIVWGYSVGTALAVEFAKDKDFDALILMSPFASRYDMSAKIFNFPIQKLFFLPNSYVSEMTIQQIKEPTFIIHGNNDIVVPFEQGRRVYENSLAVKKYFLEIDGFGHSLIPERYGLVLQWFIKDFIETKQLSQQEFFLDRVLATDILRKYEQELHIQQLDLDTDSSFQKYIDPERAFSDKWYIPADMRSLSGVYIIDAKWDLQLRDEAASQFEKLAEAFQKETWEKVVVVSSYRSYNYQVGIKSRGCPDALCAKAGHSEHQSGLALDLWSASSDAYWKSSPKLMQYYDWFSKNAYLYGFHNSYQNGKIIDGYETEPWHWRYLWVPLASYLKEKDTTFAQYYTSLKKEP